MPIFWTNLATKELGHVIYDLNIHLKPHYLTYTKQTPAGIIIIGWNVFDEERNSRIQTEIGTLKREKKSTKRDQIADVKPAPCMIN